MRKIILTTLTVVAFTGITVANDLKDKKEKTKIIDKEKECAAEQEAARQECLSNGCSEWEAYYFGAAAWGNCMGA